MSKTQKIVFLIACFLFSNLFFVNFTKAVGSATPTITDYKSTIIGTNDGYLVTGTVVPGSEVLVYIDGSFIDFAAVTKANGHSHLGNDTYWYQITQELAAGQHKLMIIGKDRTSLVLSPPTPEITFNFQNLPKPPAPTLIFPIGGSIISQTKPLITGLTKSGTRVRFYIDGILSGSSNILKHPSGTANFAFRPTYNLNMGSHSFMTVAEDNFGQISSSSKVIDFRIEAPLPAPVLLKTTVFKTTAGNRLQVSGLAKNNLSVKIFIDKKLDGIITMTNQPSGTANFSYVLAKPLTKGSHEVYTTAINQAGKESGKSNILKVAIDVTPVQVSSKPTITPEAASEEYAREEIKPIISDQETGETIKPGKNKTIDGLANDKEEIEALLKTSTGSKETETGIIDERKQGQSKIQLNLIIFIIFLVAVMGWIFWVNRELIKERKAQNENKEDKNKDNKPDSSDQLKF